MKLNHKPVFLGILLCFLCSYWCSAQPINEPTLPNPTPQAEPQTSNPPPQAEPQTSNPPQAEPQHGTSNTSKPPITETSNHPTTLLPNEQPPTSNPIISEHTNSQNIIRLQSQLNDFYVLIQTQIESLQQNIANTELQNQNRHQILTQQLDEFSATTQNQITMLDETIQNSSKQAQEQSQAQSLADDSNTSDVKSQLNQIISNIIPNLQENIITQISERREQQELALAQYQEEFHNIANQINDTITNIANIKDDFQKHQKSVQKFNETTTFYQKINWAIWSLSACLIIVLGIILCLAYKKLKKLESLTQILLEDDEVCIEDDNENWATNSEEDEEEYEDFTPSRPFIQGSYDLSDRQSSQGSYSWSDRQSSQGGYDLSDRQSSQGGYDLSDRQSSQRSYGWSDRESFQGSYGWEGSPNKKSKSKNGSKAQSSEKKTAKMQQVSPIAAQTPNSIAQTPNSIATNSNISTPDSITQTPNAIALTSNISTPDSIAQTPNSIAQTPNTIALTSNISTPDSIAQTPNSIAQTPNTIAPLGNVTVTPTQQNTSNSTKKTSGTPGDIYDNQQKLGDYGQWETSLGTSGYSSQWGTSGAGSQWGTSGSQTNPSGSGAGSQWGTSGSQTNPSGSGTGSQWGTSGSQTNPSGAGTGSQWGTSGSQTNPSGSGTGSQWGTSGSQTNPSGSGAGSQWGTSGAGSQWGTSGSGFQWGTSGNQSRDSFGSTWNANSGYRWTDSSSNTEWEELPTEPTPYEREFSIGELNYANRKPKYSKERGYATSRHHKRRPQRPYQQPIEPKYVAPQGSFYQPKVITILDTVLTTLFEQVSQAEERWPGHETGGAFIGKIKINPIHCWEEINIDGLISGGENAEHHQAFFGENRNSQTSELQSYQMLDQRISFLGDWHRHPDGMDHPSGGDRFTDSKNVSEAILSPEKGGFIYAIVCRPSRWTSRQTEQTENFFFKNGWKIRFFYMPSEDLYYFPFYPQVITGQLLSKPPQLGNADMRRAKTEFDALKNAGDSFRYEVIALNNKSYLSIDIFEQQKKMTMMIPPEYPFAKPLVCCYTAAQEPQECVCDILEHWKPEYLLINLWYCLKSRL